MGFTVLAPSRQVMGSRLGQAITVTAIYSRTGTRRNGSRDYPTVLIRNVRDAVTGELLTDHLWFNRGAVWRKAQLVEGDVVRFEARVIEYHTGYWGPNRVRQALEPARCDYRLTPPTTITVVRHLPSANREEVL